MKKYVTKYAYTKEIVSQVEIDLNEDYNIFKKKIELATNGEYVGSKNRYGMYPMPAHRGSSSLQYEQIGDSYFFYILGKQKPYVEVIDVPEIIL